MATITIKQGDTLSQIAQNQGTTVQEIQKLNPNITNVDEIQAGASLNLPEIQPTPITQNQQVETSQLSPTPPTDIPTPQTPEVSETFNQGLQVQVDNTRKELETKLKQERDRALKQQEALNKKLETIPKESDPSKRETITQEKEIIQNQLRAAEAASETIEEDFEKRRSLVGELDRLMTEGNALVSRARNAPVSLAVLNKNVNRTIQDVQARAGVVQAVLSGLDGNITQAHNIINTAQGTVRTYWNDQVNYNQTYLNLVNNGQLAKNKINEDYANSQLKLAENKLNKLEQTSDYIKGLMIDPDSAQFIADAGITLNDSVEEINEKISEQSRKEEVRDVINDLKLEGYKHVPFGSNRSDAIALEVGGETLYFTPPEQDIPDDVDDADIDTTRQFIQDNPNASREELKSELLARQDQLGLSVSQINSELDRAESQGTTAGKTDISLNQKAIGDIASAYVKEARAGFWKRLIGKDNLEEAKEIAKTQIENGVIRIQGKDYNLNTQQINQIKQQIDSI